MSVPQVDTSSSTMCTVETGANLDNISISPSLKKSMEDLPPEVLTMILEYLIDGSRNQILSYRLVIKQWRDIINELLEKRMTSGRLGPFPEMSIVDQIGEPHVLSCPAYLRRGCVIHGTLSPFNSLLLKKMRYEPGPQDIPLPAFISKIGRNLTSFMLANQIIRLNTLAMMLNSMPHLKLLSFSDVKLTFDQRNVVLPLPPSLPNLTTLKLMSTHPIHYHEEARLLSVWLISSCADKLVCLDVGGWVPALQQLHQYFHSTWHGNIPIATTSDSAFGKLEELKIFNASRDFLQHSFFPGLKSLSVIDFAVVYGPKDFRDLTVLIDKCRDTLKELRLDVSWSKLINEGTLLSFLDGAQQLPSSRFSLPFLKTLTIAYPKCDADENVLNKTLLVKFPALEELQFIVVRPNEDEDKTESDKRDEDVQNPDNLEILKERLISLREEVATTLDQKYATGMIFNELRKADPDEDPEDLDVWVRHMKEALGNYFAADEAVDAAELRLANALNRLAANGENGDEILARRMLMRCDIWNVCGELKVVSVSIKGKAKGDICVIHRPNDE